MSYIRINTFKSGHRYSGLFRKAALLPALLGTALMTSGPVCAEVQQQETSGSVMQDNILQWNLWNTFVRNNYSDGRIIDHWENREITTSEGQSYAMFFALVMNDRQMFDKLLEFTETRLARGSFENNPVSWVYGPDTPAVRKVAGEKITQDGNFIASTNNATDADLWIIYDLLEASRLFNEPSYKNKALQLISFLKKNCLYHSNVMGTLMLPGIYGFVHDDYITLNPSYYPSFIFERISKEDPDFKIIFNHTISMVLKSAGQGWFADWVDFDLNGHQIIRTDTVGSWDALRVYLWYGITNRADPYRKIVYRYAKRAIDYADRHGLFPDEYNFYSQKISEKGNIAFDAAMIPWAENRKSLQLMRTAVANHTFRPDEYYSAVIALFAIGYDNRYYRIDRNGSLLIKP